MIQIDDDLRALSPIDLREYAQTRGWLLVGEALQYGLFVLNSPNSGRQLVLPKSGEAPDFLDAARIFLEKLADIEHTSLNALIRSIRTLGEDTFRIRVPGTGGNPIEIPLSYTQELLAGTRQIIMASACSVIRPQIHHPRLSRTEAQQMVDKSSFGHTEHGSFVLQISCPLNAVEYTPQLFDGQKDNSFVRQTFLKAFEASSGIVSAVDSGNLQNLVDEQKNSTTPILSANLCEGLARLYDERLDGPIVLSFSWSPKQKLPVNMPAHNDVKIPKEYFSRIFEVGSELRRATPLSEDRHVGTVERLDGEMGDDGQRSGDVIVALLLNDGETVRARLTLNSEQYFKVDQAHMSKGSYVQIVGILHPGRQPRRMSDITEFSVIPR